MTDLPLAHAALGREVFPFRLEQAPGSEKWTKTPLVKWKDVATTDPGQIEAWRRRWPGCAWGWKLPLGSVVVDVDDQAAFDATGLLLPRTASQGTVSGGSHFLYEGLDIRQTVKAVAGIDTRVGGKGWVGLYSEEAFFNEDVALAPDWLLELGAPEARLGDASEPRPPLRTRSEIISMLGHLRRAGLDEPALLAALLSQYGTGRITESDPSRPWTKQDFTVLAREASKWPAGDPTFVPVAIGVRVRALPKALATEAHFPSRPVSTIERRDPEPLVDDFAHPTNHTILYGPSGAGKGVLAAERIAMRTRDGESVLVLDYEGHASEWRARLEDLGADLARVHLALPLGLEAGWLHGAIWTQKAPLAEEALRVGADWLYVDSVTAACGVTDISDSTAPGPYFAALNTIGIPSVSLGHVTKVEDLKYPFGSMAWRAFVRMAWSFAGDGITRDLVNRKTNDYPEQASRVYDWAWVSEMGPGRVPSALTYEAETKSIFTRLWDALDGDVLNVEEITLRLSEDGLKPVKAGTIRNALMKSETFMQPSRGRWARAQEIGVKVAK